MRVLRGVVYRLKRIGHRTEPCGTPKVRGSEGERLGGMETADVRDDRKEVNHCRGSSEMPNQVERRWSKIEWSMVSKVAERQRQDT